MRFACLIVRKVNMIPSSTQRFFLVSVVAAAALALSTERADAIGVLGHGTYFGKYHNPMQAAVLVAPAPVYVAPAPVYSVAPACAQPVSAFAPCPTPCPTPCATSCHPCAPTIAYRPVAPAPVVVAPVRLPYPIITGGYPLMPAPLFGRGLIAPVIGD